MTKKFDKFDLKIFKEIEFDYNKPHSQIAKKIKRSKSFVTYRIKKLEENRIIEFHPLIDFSKQGYTYYRIIIETPLSKKEIVEKLKDMNLPTIWIVEKNDRENFVFVVLARYNNELQHIWESLYEKLSGNIISKNISIAYKIHHLSNNYFYDPNSTKQIFISGDSKEEALSDTEKKILGEMIRNPKIPLVTLAEKIEISYITLKKHIKHMEDRKIILAYQTLLNKETLGIQAYKLFLSFDFSVSNKNVLIRLLKNYPNIVYITESSYEYDLECEAYVYDHEEIQKLINELKDSFNFNRIVLSHTKSENKLI